MDNEKGKREIGESEECERKFLLPYLPLEITTGIRDGKFDYEEIEQAYLLENGARIRKSVSSEGKISYFYTFKMKIPNTHGISSFENTKAISEEEYLRYLEEIEGEVLNKTRYFVPLEEGILEINMFHGRLEGQLLGEVEFDNLDDALSFQKPEWVGREVTNEINNRMLAMGGDIPQE